MILRDKNSVLILCTIVVAIFLARVVLVEQAACRSLHFFWGEGGGAGVRLGGPQTPKLVNLIGVNQTCDKGVRMSTG